MLFYAGGSWISEAAGASWWIWAVGGLVQVLSLGLMFHQFYLDGYRHGVASVPLDGAGLASGDARAHDGQHRWNAKLGAWERLR